MRSYKIFLNLISNFFMQLCAILAGVIVPQLILKQYGSEVNGFTSSINQFLGYFSLVEGGIGAASIIALYKPFADKDDGMIRKIFYSTSSYLDKAGVYFFAFLVLLAVGYPIFIGSGLDGLLLRELIMVIGLGKLIELIVLGRYRILLTAGQNIGIYAFAQTLGHVCTILVALLSVRLGVSIVGMQACIFLTSILKAYVLRGICRKMYGTITHKPANKNTDKIVISQQSAALVHQVASMVAYNTDMIVLTFATNLLEVSVYSVYATLFNGLQSILAVLQNVLTPAFGDMISRGERESLEKAYSLYEFAYYLITSTIAVGVILFVQPFIMLYTDGVSDYEYWDVGIAGFFIVIFLLNNFRLPGSALINAAGHLRQTQWFFIFEAVLNLIISIILVKPLGIVGCLIGTLFSGICRLLFVLLYPYYKIHRFSIKTLIKRGAYNSVLVLLAWLARGMLENKIQSWYRFFGYGIVVALVVVALQIVVAYLFDRKEIELAVRQVKLILGRGNEEIDENQRESG